MIVKSVTYSNGKCFISFVDSNFEISFPIRDDPGICPRDEIIMTNSMIWMIIRDDRKSSIFDDELPFPEVE